VFALVPSLRLSIVLAANSDATVLDWTHTLAARLLPAISDALLAAEAGPPPSPGPAAQAREAEGGC
jgi:hypothetical protein